jgi:hypothetical protein
MPLEDAAQDGIGQSEHFADPTDGTPDAQVEQQNIPEEPGDYDIVPPEIVTQAPPAAAVTNSGVAGTPPVEQSGFGEDLRARASNYFTDGELSQFGSAAELERTLTAMDRRLSQLWDQSQQEGEVSPPVGDQQQQQHPGDQGEETPQEAYKPFDLQINESEFDEDTVQLLKGLNDHYNKQLEQTHASMAQYSEQVNYLMDMQRDNENQRFADSMESFFNGLGDEWGDVFGKGDITQMDPNSPTYQNRVQTSQELVKLQELDQSFGRQQGSFQDMAMRAVRSKFGDNIQKVERNRLQQQVRQRQAQATNRPTQRAGKPMTGDEAAADFANQFFAERGIGVGGGRTFGNDV